MKKKATSQATWAVINGLVQEARVEAHRIRQLLGKILKAVDSLPEEQKEVAFQIAGDMISNIPERMTNLENRLDVLNYALALFGRDHMRERLSVADRAFVESALESAPDLNIMKKVATLSKRDRKFRRDLIRRLTASINSAPYGKRASQKTAGACDFIVFQRGSNVRQAFRNAKEAAEDDWDSDEEGYSGTIAEKRSYELRGEFKNRKEAEKFVQKDIDNNGKWDPAFVVEFPGGFLFYGYASC